MSQANGPSGGAFNSFSGGHAHNVVQAQNIGNISYGAQQNIDSRFAGIWREDIDSISPDSIQWNLRLTGEFTARPLSAPKGRVLDEIKSLIIPQGWSGQWRVSMDDVNNPWIELIAKEVDSLAIDVLSTLARGVREDRQTLASLCRSANITNFSERKFTLNWVSRDNETTGSIWSRLAN